MIKMRDLQAYEHFEGIVNPPLRTSEGADHHNTQRKTTSEQAPQPELLDSLNRNESKNIEYQKLEQKYRK